MQTSIPLHTSSNLKRTHTLRSLNRGNASNLPDDSSVTMLNWKGEHLSLKTTTAGSVAASEARVSSLRPKKV